MSHFLFSFFIVLFKRYSAAVRDLSVIVNSVCQGFAWRNLLIDNGLLDNYFSPELSRPKNMQKRRDLFQYIL